MAAALREPLPAALAALRGTHEPLLNIENLVKEFPSGRRALDGVSLQVYPGELTAVLGANGSGKSTLLRCSVRLLDPTAGSVCVNGLDLAHLDGRALREARRAVAMVFQTANLVRRRTALANVISGTLGRHQDLRTKLGFLPHVEIENGLDCLRRVGLAELAQQRADTLSGGQAQRVAIARGLSQRPRVLLADEPVASLDPEASEDVMTLLRELAERERLGILCVLHQPDLALRYAHRVIGLRAGRIVFDRSANAVEGEAVAELYRSEAA